MATGFPVILCYDEWEDYNEKEYKSSSLSGYYDSHYKRFMPTQFKMIVVMNSTLEKIQYECLAMMSRALSLAYPQRYTKPLSPLLTDVDHFLRKIA
jgi:hypothetical protein